jgi:hypothetical protein
MKIPRAALVFAGIIIAVVIAVGIMVGISSLFRASPSGETSPIQDFFSALFPFGNQVRPPNGTGQNGTEEDNRPVPALREVSAAPVAGFHFQSDGALRYAERETGRFFETRPEAYPTTRLTNTTIPEIQNVLWLNDSAVVLQYLDQNDAVKNYAASIATSTADQALVGVFLANADEIYPIDGGKTILEAVRSQNGYVVQRSKSDETSRETVFSSPLRSWRLLPAGDELFIETSPSSGPGFLYRIIDGTLSRIVGNVSGLMVLPRADGKYFAFSSTFGGAWGLYVYDVAAGRSYAMPIGTYAEKCAWFPGDAPRLACGIPSTAPNSIEDWYMGTAPLNDSVWVFEVLTGTATNARSIGEDAGRALDVERPTLSPDGTYFGFINKSDQSLWSLKLP